MDITLALVFLMIGFAILIYSGDALVKAAVSIAARLKLDPAVIGLTIIAAGTSAPELMTSLIASQKGSPDIALGNVVGSNTFNILAILGLSSIISVNKVKQSLMNFEIPMLALLSGVFILFCVNSEITHLEGALLVALFVSFTFFAVKRAKQKPETLEGELEEIEVSKSHWYDLLLLVIGIGGLALGAHLALKGGIQLGQIAGLSERVIGITIISIGTGLPELATSAVASLKGQDDIAVANVIGSNIMNTLLVVGLTAWIHPIPVSPKILNGDLYWMMGATILLLPLLYLNKRHIGKKTGWAMTLAYVFYVITLLL